MQFISDRTLSIWLTDKLEEHTVIAITVTQTDTHRASSLMLELTLGRLATVRRDAPSKICHRFGGVCIATLNALFYSIRLFEIGRAHV